MRAKFENREVGMMLFANGWPLSGSMIGVDRLEKSPPSRTGFGTEARNGRSLVVRSPSYEPNTNALFCLIGPPPVTPYWFRFSFGLAAAKKFRASSLSLRKA